MAKEVEPNSPDPMGLALAQARAAAEAGEVPVGAVLVEGASGRIIAQAHNLVEIRSDPTAHAEFLVLQEGLRTQEDKWLTDCDLYVTLEPCPFCAAAISLLRLRRLYFGAYDRKSGGIEQGPRIFDHPTCHHRPEVIGGLRESECAALLSGFFQARR